MAHTSQFAIRAGRGHVPALPSLCQHTLLPQKNMPACMTNSAREDKCGQVAQDPGAMKQSMCTPLRGWDTQNTVGIY